MVFSGSCNLIFFTYFALKEVNRNKNKICFFKKWNFKKLN